MGFSFKLKLDIKNKHTIYIDIDTDQESRLIGRHGRTINALQNLSQIFINRLGANNVDVELDTANYRSRRSDALKQLAEKKPHEMQLRTENQFTLTQCRPLNVNKFITCCRIMNMSLPIPLVKNHTG